MSPFSAPFSAAKGVLLVHGSGNDGQDLDAPNPHFPNAIAQDGAVFANWLEVGASAQKADENLVAQFSNYGKKTVDLFAPGVQIKSTVPGGGRDLADGTSMAGPVVSGAAALLLIQKPDLTGVQVRDLLRASARRYADLQVRRPGSDRKKAPFADLCVTGGVVDAFRAVELLKHGGPVPMPGQAPAVAAPQPPQGEVP